MGNLTWWTSDADLDKLFATKDMQVTGVTTRHCSFLWAATFQSCHLTSRLSVACPRFPRTLQARNWEFAIERASGKSKGFAVCEVKDDAAADTLMKEFHK